MTLVDAKDIAIENIEETLKGQRPTIKVREYSGTFSIDEVKRLYTSTPTVLVSPLSTGKDGVKLAAYLLMKSSDKGLLNIVDLIINSLRHIPGEGRPVLEVSALSLYDKDAGKIGARLWGFSVVIPHFSVGVKSELSGGPIEAEIENIKSKVLTAKSTISVGGTEAERSVLLSEGCPPFVLVAPLDGNFSTASTGLVKYSVDNVLMQRTIAGSLELPIKIECWGRDEGEAESIGLSILPLLAYVDTEEGITKRVKVKSASQSNDKSGAALFIIEVTFTSGIGSVPEVVPVFKSASTNA